MDIGIERFCQPGSSGLAHADRECDSRPDWHGLRARFLAVLALREAMDDGRRTADRPGSFDPLSARLLGLAEQGLYPVNPVALSDGKSDRGTDGRVAGTPMAGGRG